MYPESWQVRLTFACVLQTDPPDFWYQGAKEKQQQGESLNIFFL